MSDAVVWAIKAGEAFGFFQGPEEESEWTSTTGAWSRVVNFAGPLAKLNEFAETLKAYGAQTISCKKDGEVINIRATWPSASTPDGDPQDIDSTAKDPVFTAWTLTGNTQQLPLAQMPNVGGDGVDENTGIGLALMGQVLAQVRKYKIAADSDDSTVPDIDTYALRITGLDPTATAYARLFFAELVKGNDEWEFIQPVIRKVQIVTAASQVQANWANIGRAYTWEALKAAEPDLDGAVIIGVEQLEEINIEVDYVWQKRSPQLDVGHDGKRTITIEYWAWEAFSVWRYRPIIGDSASSTIGVPGGGVLTLPT